MPWQETDPVDQRSRFIDAYLAAGFSVKELCERAQVSRTTGYKLKRRGLIKRRRPRYRPEHRGVVPPVTTAPNDLWTADFKGHFRTHTMRSRDRRRAPTTAPPCVAIPRSCPLSTTRAPTW